MPELPEVETIRRALMKQLPGKRIKRIVVRDARLRWPVEEGKLRSLLVRQRIRDIQRRAKYLLVRFENENRLLLHLGMSGRILFLTKKAPLEKHDHVQFNLSGSAELRFRDPRRFGLVEAVTPEEFATHPRLVNLGVEPLDTQVDHRQLFGLAKNRKKPIKNLLMDANFMVGVGNIYANEALFFAGIHPATPVTLLGETDWKNLLQQIRSVLNAAIKQGGTTLNDFVNSDGETGYFQLSLAVYDREGKSCIRCHSKIERLVQVGRSSFFCPQCQAKT
ncbi:MAG: bifunctional DNA-formamidopyrimidine glycosylase/DNA-(apurinic or apyrimidinic site) lyase [bacterium]